MKLIREHRAVLKNPPKSAAEYLDTLEQQRLHRSVQTLKSRLTKL